MRNWLDLLVVRLTAHPRIRQSPISFLDNVFRKLSIRESKFMAATPIRAVEATLRGTDVAKIGTEIAKNLRFLPILATPLQLNELLRLLNIFYARFRAPAGRLRGRIKHIGGNV
jgi:hypothetical protein